MGEPRVPPRRVIGSANGTRIGITGLGVHVPERVVTNDDLAQYVDTTDEWIVDRTGIHERRMITEDQALTDIALPAARAALEDAGATPDDIDLLICATVTPDMMFPTASALMADTLGAEKAAAYDLLAGCTGFMYAIAQAYGMIAAGLSRRALVVGGDVLSSILDWTDRSTLVLFGDGAGAVVMEPVDHGGFLGFELGADGGGGVHLQYPGKRVAEVREPRVDAEDERPRGLQVRNAGNGLVGGGRARRVRPYHRRGRRVCPAPGKQADHRPRGR